MRHFLYFVTLLIVIPTASVQAQGKNVIFYGNSFTLGFGSTRSVNALFKDIAIAAGHDTPLVQSAAASGQDIHWHVNNNTNAIFQLIPPADDWDFIVMQEHSTKLTRAFTGSPSYPASVDQSKMDVVGLYNVAKTRSAGVVPVLYETWARGPGHAFYTGNPPIFTGPAEMQAEIRDGYDILKGELDAAMGGDMARIAPVGDAWENANFDNLHANDLWHAGNRGTLLAALVIYGTIYEDSNTSAIDLSGVLSSLSLTAQDGVFLTAAADATLVPEPTSLTLVGVCLTGLAGCGRRHSRERRNSERCSIARSDRGSHYLLQSYCKQTNR